MISLYKECWKQKEASGFTFYACGWAEYKDQILTAENIMDVIYSEYMDAGKGFEELAELLNGSYSIIISDQHKTHLISDRMRAFPLIYFFEYNQLVVTDDIIQYQSKKEIRLPIDDITCEQFLCSNYVIGPYTLFKNVYSTQSGEIVCICHVTKKIERKQYFQWAPNMNNDLYQRAYEEEAMQQDKIFRRVFMRMVKSAPDVHNWIIPLSGGYDSRTIVNYLFKLGIKNVICFTYGMESNIQSEISQKVADALGYEWHFINYKTWIQKMKAENMLEAYLGYGFNGSSVAHMQDFPAVYALIKMGIINKNDVFVPGHALEVIAGNHLKYAMQNCDSVESVIPVIHGHLSGFGYHSMKRNAVFKHVQSIIANYNLDPKQIAECFDWQERQTKFIANSVKVYEYFENGWRMPEWDIELMNYWNKIGFNYKYKRNMFKDVFKKYLAVDVLKSIPFANDLIAKQKPSYKSYLINSIPFWLKRVLKKSGIPSSHYYVDEGAHLIYSDYSETIADYLSSYNAPIIVRKYLKPYSQRQKLSDFEVNSVTTLLNIRKCIH